MSEPLVLQYGDWVRWREGRSPTMRVLYADGGDSVECIWFDRHDVMHATWFRVAWLCRAPAPRRAR